MTNEDFNTLEALLQALADLVDEHYCRLIDDDTISDSRADHYADVSEEIQGQIDAVILTLHRFRPAK